MSPFGIRGVFGNTDLHQPPGLCGNGCLDPVEGKAIDLLLEADRRLADLDRQRSTSATAAENENAEKMPACSSTFVIRA